MGTHTHYVRDICFDERKTWLRQAPVQYSRAIAYMAQNIVRNPFDLLLHVHRINLCHVLKDQEALYGAIIDLFIVLGKNGHALRQRLLAVVATTLKTVRYDFLVNHLESGISAYDAIDTGGHSCLGCGMSGDAVLVDRVATYEADEIPVLLEARDLIDSGQIDKARILLERALEAMPGDEELSRELLLLFRSSRDQDKFTTFYRRFSQRPLALQDEWLSLWRQFSSIRQDTL